MKKKLFFLFIILFNGFCFSQSTEEMLIEIQGKWTLDNKGNVTFTKIIEVPELKKEEIYNSILNYLISNYVNGKQAIQYYNKETGILIAKGVYENVTSNLGTTMNTIYTLRIDIKDRKARAKITLAEYDGQIVSLKGTSSYFSIKLSDKYPINPKGKSKKFMIQAFYNTYQKVMSTFDTLEKTIEKIDTLQMIENSNW